MSTVVKIPRQWSIRKFLRMTVSEFAVNTVLAHMDRKAGAVHYPAVVRMNYRARRR